MSQEKADRVREIADEIRDLLKEAKKIARTTDGIFYEHYEGYVFEQIEEHLSKSNRYNKDFEDLANDLEGLGEVDEEDGEGLDDEDED